MIELGPDTSFRAARDLWLKRDFTKKEAEKLESPWKEFCLSALADQPREEIEALKLLGQGALWMRYFSAELLLRRLDLYALARQEIDAVIKGCPELWEARCLRAEILMALGEKDPLDAVKAMKLNEPAFYAWRGALHLWSGDYRAALSDLDEAAFKQNPDAFCWRGAAKVMLGRPKEALVDLDLLLDRDPSDPEALVWRGEARRLLGSIDRSLEDLDAVIAQSGDKPWAHANRALLRNSQHDHKGAVEDFARLYQRHETNFALDPESIAPERLKELLLALLKSAKGCRRSDAHLNIAWMRAAGVPVPARPGRAARLLDWMRAQKAPSCPEPLPHFISENQVHGIRLQAS